MLVTPLEIPDVKLITPTLFADDRGFFFESYHRDTFAAHGIYDSFVQDNISQSSKGTLRGLHFQNAPRAQAKLVRVFKGRVFDVAVDIRPNSATFKKWVGVELSEDQHNMLYIPKGFAHGFYTLSDTAIFHYKCGDIYDKAREGSVAWNDPEIGISWPLIEGQPPILSDKDKTAKPLRELTLHLFE